MVFEIIIALIPTILSLITIFYKFFGKSGSYLVKLKNSDKWVKVNDLGSNEDLRKLMETVS
ncbi:hypothetical protein [Dyadobacter sp. Leaf189]|uniref:hypothetical protein n=1 Tax=Dyadobacter sp. Leaf189 TaxID=1736295 RepID=UPI0006F30371|nr:hypothetical protein [Dyadobacter sp. Leaf189]KQS34061.1 hypothetical protein ASG33_08570 [Dyadobacter sp. Leaf189]